MLVFSQNKWPFLSVTLKTYGLDFLKHRAEFGLFVIFTRCSKNTRNSFHQAPNYNRAALLTTAISITSQLLGSSGGNVPSRHTSTSEGSEK